MIAIDGDLALRLGAHMPPYFLQPKKRKPPRSTLNAKEQANRTQKRKQRLQQRKKNRK